MSSNNDNSTNNKNNVNINTDNRLYQLDELISDIYKAVYIKDNDYTIKFIDVKDINLPRFKLSDYDLDIIFDKIKYAGSFPTGIVIDGTSTNEIWFKRRGETEMSTIRIVPYRSKEAVDDITDPINVNQIMKTLLSELVVSEKTNNLLLPVINVDVLGSDLTTYGKISPYINSSDNTYYSVQVTEKYYSLKTLDQFFKDYVIEARTIKSIIYQAIDVLYQISVQYPKFKYNQLFPETIDCYLKQDNNLIIPEIKLSNFYLSSIDDLVKNSYLDSNDFTVEQIADQYGDLYQLVNYMWNNLQSSIQNFPDVIKIFDIVLPKKIRSKELYLTSELWNLLSEDEKFELKIKNLRNNHVFTSKDSLSNTTFVKSKDQPIDFSGGSEDNELSVEDFETSEDLNDIDESIPVVKNSSKIKYPHKDIGIMANNKTISDRKLTDNLSNKSSNDNTSETTSDKSYRSSNSRNSDNSKSKTTRSKTQSSDSSKSSRMPRSSESKRSTNSVVSVGSTGSDVYSDMERTEYPSRSTYKSRTINRSDSESSPVSSHTSSPVDDSRLKQSRISEDKPRKNKAYRGRRVIGQNNTASLLAALNDDNYNQGQNNVTDINSIGSMLGVSVNELASKNSNPNYSQIMQQIASQMNGQQASPNSLFGQAGNINQQLNPQQLSALLGQSYNPNTQFNQLNQLGQLGQLNSMNSINQMAQLGQMGQLGQTGQVNPMSQMSQMSQMNPMNPMGQPNQSYNSQNDTDLLYRYMATLNQGQPGQQMDPNAIATLMQQNSTGFPSYAQLGGNVNNNNNMNRNPFFFQ
ncbi:hypothetical protein HIRU_S556 [Hirudovirus strain Sangsue]|nr:hypothetical protein HIRU_S556 [Hirudovirus strain Sangsue]